MTEENQNLNEERQKTMLSFLKDLKTFRTKKEQLKEAYENAMNEFKDLNALLLESIDKNKTQMEASEESLRILALDEFKETGSKQLTGGIGIRILKKLEYDNCTALGWAIAHGLALQLNKREFEIMAKTGNITDLNFVKIKEEPQATLPKEIKLEEK